MCQSSLVSCIAALSTPGAVFAGHADLLGALRHLFGEVTWLWIEGYVTAVR